MFCFDNDYLEGAHPELLRRLTETNFEKLTGYGKDDYCESAKEKIRAACECPGAAVYLTVGGTQTNQVVLSALLENYQGVVAVKSGHVNGHEAGAIEYTGHKVLAVEGREGKLQADTLQAYLTEFYDEPSHDHGVFPGAVYISHPTEYGTLYTKGELEALAEICRRYGMPLYLDGARLGYGLTAPHTDVTLADLARLCDAFYIGGTKVGALCGEAIVFPRREPPHFMTQIKQHGALLAKGRLLGVQFDALFTDGLYERISRNAIETAERLRRALREKGYRFLMETETNQLFPVFTDEKIAELKKFGKVRVWERVDETHSAVRFVTSWASRTEEIDELIAHL